LKKRPEDSRSPEQLASLIINDRLRLETRGLQLSEINREIEYLSQRPDYFSELDYFLDLCLHMGSPKKISQRTNRKVALLWCLSSPVEVVLATGFQPIRFPGGCVAPRSLSEAMLKSVSCPMLRTAIGSLMAQDPGEDDRVAAMVFPTTCDWAAKTDAFLDLDKVWDKTPRLQVKFPVLKDRLACQEAWLDEVYSLVDFLGGLGHPPKRRDLSQAVATFDKAYWALSELVDLKRLGLVPEIWFLVIANTVYLDVTERWVKAVKKVKDYFQKAKPLPGKAVYLAGSPIFFPNFKFLKLLEKAGLKVVVDDFCSSERAVVGPINHEDSSFHGRLKALTLRYRENCLCPSIVGSEHRVKLILDPKKRKLFNSVVFHVLKGCQPFELESLNLEAKIKAEGLRFIRIEEDYSPIEEAALLNRLLDFAKVL
jgi:benzoyl-CoA reductase/2-hydroxyglutaryl-CoA dehydratase subunit BcrC/BadD/HgdB